MQANAALTGTHEMATGDLGPLAWVLDELRKSLDGATRALQRFVRDAELARGSDLAALDASQLRIARQQLHQAVGALEMVGQPAPAKVLRSMEALAQRFVQRPELCSDEAANKVERASFALIEYLEGVLKGKSASSVALFPQYRDVLELVGDDRVHPADLWSMDMRWIDMALPTTDAPLAYDSSVRVRIDRYVLQVVKSGDPVAAKALMTISLGFAAAQEPLEQRVFWKICAAYFEAVSKGLCPADVYGKRMASRVLLQYRILARGESAISERLVQDLLFFIAQAVPGADTDAPVLAAVRAAYGLTQTKPFNYDKPQFGRFDPALLVQARKRLAAATETWSALAGGDTNRLKVAVDQFSLVTDSVLKLHPESADLVNALTHAIELTARSGEAPSAPLAMEVATAVLYLEAAYEDLDPTDSHMAERGANLARRLEHVNAGGQPEPLESWMEELYRRVSDRQIMGSVVDELRTSLGEVEKSLDAFFRNPMDKKPLHEVPSQLAQMRGVFSVLGLDQAAIASLRMRDSVERFLVDDIDLETARTGIFEKLGNSLGALGFLIDMLSYQRAMAKKLFAYDEEAGEFKPVMGREKPAVVEPVAAPEPLADIDFDLQSDAVEAHLLEGVELPLASGKQQFVPEVSVPETFAAFVEEALPAPVAAAEPVAAELVPVLAAEPLDDDDFDIRDIFLEEAREVVQTGQDAIRSLATDPSDLSQQATLRRAFHTLKGSARMVGLTEFGEAAWSLEQLLNNWLAEQKPASPDLLSLSDRAMQGFCRWVEDIAAGTDSHWDGEAFRKAADGLRVEGELLALPLPGDKLPEADELLLPQEMPMAAELAQQDFLQTQTFDLAEMEAINSSLGATPSEAAPIPQEPATLDFDDFDFGDMFAPEPTPVVAQALPDEEELTITESGALAGDLAPAGQPDEPDALPLEQVEAEAIEAEAVEAQEIEVMATEETKEIEVEVEPEIKQEIAQEMEPEAEPSDFMGLDDEDEDQIKVIGDLRIGLPLYNVYLNEADEWSRRLLTELNEWSFELDRPLSGSTVGLAHSLSGSSATVGFFALSEIARALEQALHHVQLHAQGTAEHAQIFIESAEDIRRLLHQFAAGFLKKPDPALIEALKEILDTEFPSVLDALNDNFELEYGPLDDWDVEASAANDAVQVPIAELEAEAATEPVFDLELSDLVTEANSSVLEAELEVLLDLEPDSEPEPTAEVGVPVANNFSAAVSPLMIDDRDDDIDAVDLLDVDLFPIFEEEALELLPKLGTTLRQWMADPDKMAARSEVLRVVHTLKGSARLAGAMQMGEMTHRMESAIEYLGMESLQASQLEPLLARFDAIQANFDALRALPEQLLSLPEAAIAAADEATLAEAPAVNAGLPQPLASVQVNAAAFAPLAPARQLTNQSVRVRSQLLDRMVNQSGEVMITRSRLEARVGQLRGSLNELTGNLDRLRNQLRDIELQSESQMQSRLAQAKDSAQGFDPLEFDRFTRVQELTRMMAESVHDVATVQRNLQRTVEGTEDDLIAQGRQARELQRDLLRTRMVEFDGISERLYGVVRQAAKDAGKSVKLDIVGGSLDMDRGVLDRMAPAFEHLLRNAVAHGIEEPAARLAVGKPASGTIKILLQQQSNDVTVEFSDDGAGLDLDRIRDKAMADGQFSESDAPTDAELAALIFDAGFSTASQVTELAGRGIGMDVVRSEVNALGGRIETATQRGLGTQFKLVLPLTTAVTQVVMLRIGDLVFGVPANLIEMVRRVPVAELERAYQDDEFEFSGEKVPFYWAGALLQASTGSSEVRTKTLAVAVFRSAGQRLAAHVDEVLGNQEVVVKNLGPQLSRLPGLTGMSVLASGAVILIYNPVALASVYGEQARLLKPVPTSATGKSAAPETLLVTAGGQSPLVLVVDDSITVRRVTQRLLKREGFRVALAADGLQALERLQEEKPMLVLSDIEMPRMDGFDLARNIRADAKLRDLPIIMITSRIAEKHREHARALGVDHYLGKPYSEDELVGLVRQYSLTPVNP
jgi:chemosensory pili system protein ChpA (sensor histidine kinase/response regulator)